MSLLRFMYIYIVGWQATQKLNSKNSIKYMIFGGECLPGPYQSIKRNSIYLIELLNSLIGFFWATGQLTNKSMIEIHITQNFSSVPQ